MFAGRLLRLICVFGLLAFVAPPGSATEPQSIVVREDPEPASLMRWHLYERLDERPRLGDKIAFVGRYDPQDQTISLASPPWLTIAFPKQPGGSEAFETHQAFQFACDKIAGLDQHGFAKFTGHLAFHRPELTPREKSNQNILVFRLERLQAEPLRLARSPQELLAAAADDIRRHEPRLRELCQKFALTYAFRGEDLSWSWCEGQLACTTIVSRHPGFSFTPVPYATISALYDPATGKLARLIFTRRTWQDPRD